MPDDDYAEKNRAAWNQAAPVHRAHRKDALLQAVKSPSFNVLDQTAQRTLSTIGIEGCKVAQLCCNNGRELISLLKMGASSGVGFDISDAFIAEARQLAALAEVNCKFVRTNVLDIREAHHRRYDLVFISVGVLSWFADLDRFFAVCQRLLLPGGSLFIYEMHPFLDMLAAPDDPEYDIEDELKIAFPYFSTKPWVSVNGLDYVGGTTYESSEAISFPHTFSEIFTTILSNGFRITSFEEHPYGVSGAFKHLEKHQKIPMCYTLTARKKRNED